MWIRLITRIFLVASILVTTQVHIAAAADTQGSQASELFDQIIPKEIFLDLYSQALSTLREYVEVEGNLPDKGASLQRSGEFRLKLFPHGKSRSQEHLSAEGSFRLSPEADQQEFSLRFKSSKNAQRPLGPNGDVI
ncbi:MAG: conserved exported protein of unknown function [Nitrospira sp.]|nr:MAG: conserved exported protein of unknown function [Nitrospira sp.]